MCVDKQGVLPLVCAVCKRVVGVVNVAEFERMTTAEEVYICAQCMTHPEKYIESTLRGFTPGQWADMTWLVIQVPTYLPSAEFNHGVPVFEAQAIHTPAGII